MGRSWLRRCDLWRAGLLIVAGLSCSRSDRMERALEAHAKRIGAPETVMKFPTPAEVPGSGSFRQTDWFRLSWRQQRLIAWERRGMDRGAVVFVGDSIIQDWANLEASFPGVKLANRGLAGDTSRGVLSRLREDVLELAPPMVVLLCGINDLGDGDNPESVLQNLREILAICQTNHPRPRLILCNLLPVGNTNAAVNAKVQELNQKLNQLADAQAGVLIADGWSALADKTGSATPQDFPDLLHPNASGYHKLAGVIRPLLRAGTPESAP